MNAVHLGDSYDLVKRHLLHALGPPEKWAVHPMLTEAVDVFGEQQKTAYTRLLDLGEGAIISWDTVPGRRAAREAYFHPCQGSTNIFLDPNTGFSSRKKKKWPRNYLYEEDLRHIVRRPSQGLTMIFDQSTSRLGLELQKRTLAERLHELEKRHHFASLAYVSHACFLFLAEGTEVVTQTRQLLMATGNIPANRLIPSMPSG
jgi:hypothetical protein